MAQVRRTGPRGLPAIAKNREERAHGPRWGSPRTVYLGVLALVGALVTYKFVSEHELSSDRNALLAKQRAVAATIGEKWYPLRDEIEREIMAAANGEGPSHDFEGDLVTPVAKTGDFRSQPGIYLRMRIAEARDPKGIRRVAADAKRDAFASCLLREANERGMRGETAGAAFPEQPWNLGQAYAATRLLGDEWVDAVKGADDDLRLRLFSEQYDKAVRDEIPVAIDVVQRSQFFLLVLDEDVPEAAQFADGGPISEESLQLTVHPARIFVFDRKGQPILRLQRSAGARVIAAGERAVTDDETHDAMQRQANNCALANAVTAELHPKTP